MARIHGQYVKLETWFLLEANTYKPFSACSTAFFWESKTRFEKNFRRRTFQSISAGLSSRELRRQKNQTHVLRNLQILALLERNPVENHDYSFSFPKPLRSLHPPSFKNFCKPSGRIGPDQGFPGLFLFRGPMAPDPNKNAG